MALVILGAFDACFAEGGAEHVGAEASEEKAKSHLGIKKDLDKLLKAPLIHCNTVALPPTPPSSLLSLLFNSSSPSHVLEDHHTFPPPKVPGCNLVDGGKEGKMYRLPARH